MAVRDGRGDVKQTMTGFPDPLMALESGSIKSKFLSLKGFFLKLQIVNIVLIWMNML